MSGRLARQPSAPGTPSQFVNHEFALQWSAGARPSRTGAGAAAPNPHNDGTPEPLSKIF